MEPTFLLIVIAGILAFIILFTYFVPIRLWFTAVVSGVRVSILQLVLMRFRKVPP